MTEKVNLLNFNRAQMVSFIESLDEPRYRAEQLIKWIHFFGATDFSVMTNLSKKFREKLSAIACIDVPTIMTSQQSSDGTRKWLMRLNCGNAIETVYIPEDDRGTLCVSSQVGCALNCSFCATARQGFNRNLSVAEIIGQLWVAARALSDENGTHDRKVTNIVMMGMGEPLLNFDPVVAAMDLMMDDFAYGLSKRRVTLSTSGVLPAMEQLRKVSDVSLAVSLHAPNDELRNVLVPINKKYPVKELMTVCKNYFADDPRRAVTFEYVMLNEVNDSPAHARQLIKILDGFRSKVNLIPFNPVDGIEYKCSSKKRIDAFRNILTEAGINTITRKTRGDDIDAACGQLVGNVQDKTSRSKRLQDKARDAA